MVFYRANGKNIHAHTQIQIRLKRAFITGETNHSFHHLAEELGMNVIYGGHWATETLGVKALGRHLEEELGIETRFIDLPTGL